MIDRRTTSAYDRIAPAFAARNAAMPPELVDLGRRFQALAGARAAVLEVGCGAGRDMAWLEAHGMIVTGIDLSGGMLTEARSRTAGALLRMDMCRLAFADGRFNGIWCMASLLHLPKEMAGAALREMHRVLVPRGVLALGIQEGAGEGWEHGGYGQEVDRFFARYTQPGAEALLRAAGFGVQTWSRNEAGSRRWLQFLALA